MQNEVILLKIVETNLWILRHFLINKTLHFFLNFFYIKNLKICWYDFTKIAIVSVDEQNKEYWKCYEPKDIVNF